MRKRIKNITEYIRVKFFQPFFRKMCGWDKLEERLEAIEYIINKGIDITSFPPATGLLRQCQIAGGELLRIVCRTLEDNGLTYWLDYGTLLGAVRHKGYIPWDDDLDIAMTRQDYEIACEILPKELKKFGIKVTAPNDERIGISIWKAGLIMDIFPMDNVDENSIKSFDELRDKTIEFRKYYVKNKKLSLSVLREKRHEMIGSPSESNPLWYHNAEFCADRTVYSNNTIFPLKEMSFEGHLFKVPNDCHQYLIETYGDYMSMPKGGILHHQGGNGDNGIIYNVIKYNTDIEAKIEELKRF